MISLLHIHNYKSLKEVNVDVGQFNVLIGENGSGKSNFLEVLAVYSAAVANRLQNEFMLSRGIRVVEPQTMFSIFKTESELDSQQIKNDCHFQIVNSDLVSCTVTLNYDNNQPFSELQHTLHFSYATDDTEEPLSYTTDEESLTQLQEDFDRIVSECSFLKIELPYDFYKVLTSYLKFFKSIKDHPQDERDKQAEIAIENLRKLEIYENIKNQIHAYNNKNKKNQWIDFVIFSPENSKLRVFSSESQIEPLGVNGEGLLKLLQVMQEHEPEQFKRVIEISSMFQWVEKIVIEKDESNPEKRIKIIDRFMGYEIDHRSANEGFLFVLFYAALFSSRFTPDVFAVDNIDASLNPKLCRVLIKELILLAKESGKQAFVTTHNPAILDGIDLHDDEQRLFVVERKDEGDTQLRRIGIDELPKPTRSGQTIKLSEAFMRGLLGGLPTNF